MFKMPYFGYCALLLKYTRVSVEMNPGRCRECECGCKYGASEPLLPDNKEISALK
jgi:hypothetical protein